MLRRRQTPRVLLLFFCAPLAFCWAQQPTAAEILKRVAETYKNLQSYQFIAEEVTEILPGHASKTDISLSYSAPGKIRLEVMDEENTLVIVSDGKTRWTYLPRRNEYTQEAGSGDDVVTRGRRKLTMPEYRSQLVERFRNLPEDDSSAVVEKEDWLKVGANMVACHLVKIQRQDGSSDELWVDKDRYIVWKSRHVAPSVGRGTLPSITITVSEAKVNAELGKSVFHFGPAANARRVRSFE